MENGPFNSIRDYLSWASKYDGVVSKLSIL